MNANSNIAAQSIVEKPIVDAKLSNLTSTASNSEIIREPVEKESVKEVDTYHIFAETDGGLHVDDYVEARPEDAKSSNTGSIMMTPKVHNTEPADLPNLPSPSPSSQNVTQPSSQD